MASILLADRSGPSVNIITLDSTELSKGLRFSSHTGLIAIMVPAWRDFTDAIMTAGAEKPDVRIMLSGVLPTVSPCDSACISFISIYDTMKPEEAINPVWKENLKPLLSLVESKVIIFTDGPDLSTKRMEAMKYHDRIAGSHIHYLKSDAMNTLLEHPDRLIKVLEDGLDAR